MVLPISGPTRQTWQVATFYRRRDRYKQAYPFTLPLKYNFLWGEVVRATGNLLGRSPANSSEDLWNLSISSSKMNQARMLAYARFLNEISDRASMAENLFEYEKTLKVLTSRATQLFQFTKAVKRGNLKKAADILRTPEPKVRHPVKQAANNWLEFHLGIAPVIGDIYSAIDILQNPIKNVRIRAGAVGGNGELSRYSNPNASYSIGSQVWTLIKCSVKYGADVAVSNPNLYLANSLGLVNPAVVAWQLVPLSFVLDWFINVEQFLGTGSDLWGLTLLNAYTTAYFEARYYEYWNTYGWEYASKCFGIYRDLGITTPSLGLRPYKALSWQRGLTAVSLLVGGLKSLNQTGYNAASRRLIIDRNDHRWADGTYS